MARTVGMILTEALIPAEKLICPHCGRGYKSAAALRAHVEKAHPQQLDETDGEQG